MKRLWTVLALALFSFAAVSTPIAFAAEAEPTEQGDGDKDKKKDEKKDDKKDEKKDPKKRFRA